MHLKKSVLVIGSGIAGLAAAIRLSAEGFDVSIFEKNDVPGGKITAFEKNGYHFDAGPSLFTQPSNMEDLCVIAGEDPESHFQYSKVDISCTYFYDNGKVIRAYADTDKFAREANEVTGDPVSSVTGCLQHAKKLYLNVGELFTQNSLHRKRTWFNRKIIKALAATRSAYLFSTLDKYNKRVFRSPELQQMFNRFATYNGSDPYRAPAMLSMIPHLEMNIGTFYPAGGMISITDALYKIALKKGVRFYFNTPVERIIHTEGKVAGVVVAGKNIKADVVISNSDIYFTYRDLLRQHDKANKLLKHERSSSALIFYWGIGKQHSALGLHNILFSKDYKQEFIDIFRNKKVHEDPTIYINITSKYDPTHAPAGKENWFVMINVPAGLQLNEESISAIRDRTIQKIDRLLNTDICSVLECETIWDPETIEQRTGSYMGSLYGTSSNTTTAAFSRHPNFSRYAAGLYFCGGSVHPGGGIPLCLNSAKIACDLIIHDLRFKR